MTWADSIGKRDDGEGKKVRIVEEENNFPIANPNYLRIGSAHAVERGSDREALVALLRKFADTVNLDFGQSPDSNTIVIEEK